MSKLLPGEQVLWEGRPDWRALGRDALGIGWVALYFAAVILWNAWGDRTEGLDLPRTLLAALPLTAVAVAVLGGMAGLAWAMARSTRYTLTTERCILRYGVALEGTLSVPLRRVAAVAVATGEGGTGNIPLRLKPGSRVAYLKLWPHVRPWRLRRAEPMLRGVPHAAAVAALLSQAAAQVTPGVMHAAPEKRRAAAVPVDATILPAAGD